MEISLARFIFVALCLVGPVFAAINLGQFRGVPKSDTSEGNKFCFAFLDSIGSGSGDRSATKNLGIYIGTQESEPVQYRIRSGVSDVSRTGTVQPGEIKRELYRHITGNTVTNLATTPPTIANMLPVVSPDASARAINDHTGIIVETVNSSQKISVMGFSDASGSSDGFAAVPIFNVSSIVQSYSYSVLSGIETSNFRGEAAIVACDSIETGGVTLYYPRAPELNFFTSPNGYFGQFNLGYEPQPSEIIFEQYYTPILTGPSENIAGITAVSTQPIGFMAGHQCGEVPLSIINCDHYVEQIPPSYTWGYNFLIAPFHSRDFGYIIKIVPYFFSNADYKLVCVNASNGAVTRNLTVQNFVIAERLVENRGVFDIGEQAYCSIQSNKPIAVMQYAKGHEIDDPSRDRRSTKTIQDLADPAMTWVPSAGQYLNRYLISNDVFLIGQNDPFSSNGVYITVLPECFNASAILDNVTALESDASKWGRFYCDDLNDICGYGISVDIPQGDHLLRHADPNCAFGAIFFGWGDQKGYAYPAGFGMRPIAETFYTIEPLIPSARESSLGPVSVTVYKSGNVSAASSVEITTIMSSSANAATIGTDLQTQSSTVNFAAGQTSAVATFNFMDDNNPESFETFLVGFVPDQNITIGTPSQAELGIIDDDSVTIQFNPVTYNVTERDSNVALNITFVTSQPLFGASTIRITSIPAAGAANQATAGVDYVAFNETITLPAGSTGHYYTTTILSNSEAEPAELFSATLEFVSGSQLIVTGPDATVTINDVDVPTIRFQPVMYTAIEGRNGQAVSETIRGVTSQPLLGETTIRLTDVPTPGATSPATRNADYTGFTQDIVLPVGAMEFFYNVTILSDESVEQSEVFDVDLSRLSGSPLTVVGPDATVTITDSSFITLMFSAPDYSVPENDGRVTLNITASAPVTSNTVISLTYIETNGGALNGSDFSRVPATVTILSGQSSVSFTVDITNDIRPEPTESFDIRMALQSGQSIVVPSGTDTATVTITDSDRSLISYSPDLVVRQEEDSPAPLRIIVEPPYFETFQFESFSVQFNDQNDLAQAGIDYISFNDSLTAVNGSGPILHSVVLRDDEIMELDEEFGVRLNVLGNVRVDVASSVEFARVVIEDTDRINIGFQRPLYVTDEPEISNNVVEIIAETRGTSARSFSVNVEFIDDSAIGGGEDYDERRPSTISASFEAGTNRNATIIANVLSDDIDEFTERFNLSLAFGTNDPFVDRIDFFRKDTIVEILDSDSKQK